MDPMLKDVCISAALALVGTVAFVYVGISELNKEAKEKGLSEKGYSLGSVVASAVIGFFMLFMLIFRFI